MKFMVIDLARFGDQRTTFDVFDTEEKGYSIFLPRGIDLVETAACLADELRKRPVDYMCMAGHGITYAFMVMLGHVAHKMPPILTTDR